MKSSCVIHKSRCLAPRSINGTEWSVLSSEEIKIFNQNVVCRSYNSGDIVFIEGDICKGLYFVESGLVGVKKMDADGRQVLLLLANPGDTLGYRPLLAKENHRATAEVMREAKICFLPKDIIHLLLSRNPQLGAKFLQRTARALGAADERFFEMVSLTARVRFIHLLKILQERCGYVVEDGSLCLELPVTRCEIASMLGIRSESFSRLVREIETEGFVHFSGSRITIANPELLFKEFDAALYPI